MQVVLKHRDFKEPVTAMLKSDAKGRVGLGELKDIVSVTATGLGGPGHVWQLPEDHHSYRSVIDAKAGDVVRIPWLGGALSRFEAAFFEVIDNTIVSDKFDALVVKDGLLEIADLKPGDYDLLFKASGERIRIRVVEGVAQSGWVLGQLRHLELAEAAALHDCEHRDGGGFAHDQTAGCLAVRAGARDRLAVPAGVFGVCGFREGAGRRACAASIPASRTAFISPAGRLATNIATCSTASIRRSIAGNMLDRPQLLLNPWAVRSTETGEQVAAGGESFGARGGVNAPRASGSARQSERMMAEGRRDCGWSSLRLTSTTSPTARWCWRTSCRIRMASSR